MIETGFGERQTRRHGGGRQDVTDREEVRADGRADHGWWTVFARAVFAGWLVAGVVWLDHAAQDTIARFLQIYVIFYMIAAAELYHVITAAGDAFFYLFVTGADPLTVFAAYWLPILLGNTIGGVLLFTLVNYAQTDPMKFSDAPLLSRREMLFSWRGGPETV